MAIETYVLWMDVITLLFILLSLAFFVKSREYEKSMFEGSMNVLLFGFLIIFLAKIIDILEHVNNLYPSILADYGLATYVPNMVTISAVALVPLFAVCVLMAVIFARDAFEESE